MQLSTPRSTRILLYSHDSFGLGHLRRCLNLAGRLVQLVPGASALIVTGNPCATQFTVPAGVDVVKLPTVGKDELGAYVPRISSALEQVIAVRRSILRGAWDSFRPNLLIVDHQVTGLFDEVLDLLKSARSNDVRTILGVRDVIDAPDRVATEWNRDSVRWALRVGYDRVCVYGSPEVFDARAAYPFPPELGERLEYVGYVVRPGLCTGPAAMPELDPEVIVTTGGGEDGEQRIATYLEALALAPAHWTSTIVLGPMLSSEAERRLRLRARGIAGIEWHRFLPDLPQRMARAEGIVAMAGYNTVAELLALGRRAVLMPRTFPRREQELRARALERLDLAEVVCEFRPDELRRKIEASLENRSRHDFPSLRLDGVDRLAQVAAELLDRQCAFELEPAQVSA